MTRFANPYISTFPAPPTHPEKGPAMTTTTAWLFAAWQSRASGPARRRRPTCTPIDDRRPRSPQRLHHDRGEGVISVAIAVLIMAFLGAAMWVGFQAMWDTTNERTTEQVGRIGSDGG